MQDNNTTNVLIGVIGFVVIAVGIFFFARKKSSGIEYIKQATLSMKEVIGFFQQTEVVNLLKANGNLSALAIRQKQGNGSLKITLTLYDKKQEKILHCPHTKVYLVKSIDADLTQNFGDKDMIVVE